MKIDRIQYKKIFPLGSYTTEHIGLEASLDENENPEEALTKLITITNELHSATIATLEEYRGTTTRTIGEQEQQVEKIPDEIQSMLDGINGCTELEGQDGLKSFWLRSKGNLALSTAYKNKEKQLQNA